MYTGFGDIVACFECGIIHRRWQRDDDPVKTHIMLQPDCPYIMDLIEEGIQSCEQFQRFGSCSKVSYKFQVLYNWRSWETI